MNTRPVKTILALCLLCSAIHIQAQTHFGARAGVHLANVRTTEAGAITRDRMAGAHIALLLDHGITNSLAIQPELNFIQRGFRRDIGSTNDYRYRINYADAAVLLKYSFGPRDRKSSPRIHGYALAGPFAGFAGWGTVKNAYDGEKRDLFSGSGVQLVRTDAGMIFGGGIGHTLGNGELLVDIRYQLGLVNINEYYLEDGNIRSRGWTAGIGYMLRIGK